MYSRATGSKTTAHILTVHPLLSTYPQPHSKQHNLPCLLEKLYK